MSTIFLDRDGVINENRADYVKSWSEFCFVGGSREAIARLTRAGHTIVICTNQAAIARGHASIEVIEDIHRRMIAEIATVGGEVAKVYYCPHAKDANCFCRKPRPGMLLRARDELGIDLQDAVFIGDSITDIQAARSANVHSMLVLSGLGVEQFRNHYHEANGPFRISMDLQDAAERILQGLYVRNSGRSALEHACYSLLGASKHSDILSVADVLCLPSEV